MVKEPRPGRVKTRLAGDIGTVPAAWWYRHNCARLLRRLADRRWRLRLAVSPDSAGMRSRVWPAGLSRMPQGEGDLGARMLRCLGRARGPAVLVGSDIPGLGPAHVARAFRALGGADMVFGPALDGGFWLVGARHPQRLPRGLFAGVPWSGPQVLEEVRAGIPGLTVALADRLADVDRAQDLASLTGSHPRSFDSARSS